MKIEKIITLANSKVQLQFHAMERSLRNSGCSLPLLVIPFDNQRFDLPENASWWENKELFDWLDSKQAAPHMRKYLCLLTKNYHCTDTDVCFLSDPKVYFEQHTGFITSCGHWRNPKDAVISQSQKLLAQKDPLWQRTVFNAGQFTCDRELYDFKNLKDFIEHPDHVATCLNFPFHEQPGINLLVKFSDVEISNITLEPPYVASTWAGDYGDNYMEHWEEINRKPPFIHWAGLKPNGEKEIDQLFLANLTPQELSDWKKLQTSSPNKDIYKSKLFSMLKRTRRAVQSFYNILRATE